jgi:hypothetical protein
MMEHQQYFKFDIDLPQEQVVNNVYSHFVGNLYWGLTYIETYTNDLGQNVVLIGGFTMRRLIKRGVAATLKIIETTTASAQVIVALRSTASRDLTDFEAQVIYPQIKRFCHEPYVNRVSEFFKRISRKSKEKRR